MIDIMMESNSALLQQHTGNKKIGFAQGRRGAEEGK